MGYCPLVWHHWGASPHYEVSQAKEFWASLEVASRSGKAFEPLYGWEAHVELFRRVVYEGMYFAHMSFASTPLVGEVLSIGESYYPSGEACSANPLMGILMATSRGIASVYSGWNSILSKRKRPNRSRLSYQQKSAIIKGLLSGSPQFVAGNARSVVSPNLYPELLQWMRRIPWAFPRPFPKLIAQFKVVPPTSSTSTDRELRWASAYLDLWVTPITRFVSMSRSFRCALLMGNYDNAKIFLNEIEEEFGYSIWLIKNRIALIQIASGLDAHKQYVSQLKAETTGTVAFLAHFISTYNEPSVSLESFSAYIAEYIPKLELPEWVSAYLYHHLLPQNVVSPEMAGGILRFEYGTTVIDYYETFVSVSQIIVSCRYKGLYSALRASIKPILFHIGDSRLAMLDFVVSGEAPLKLVSVEEAVEAHSLYLAGRYEEAMCKATYALQHFPDNFDAMEIAARSSAMLSTPLKLVSSFHQDLIEAMSRLLLYRAQAVPEIYKLFKLALTFSTQSWAHALLGFIWKEIAKDPIETVNDTQTFAGVASPFIHPLRIVDLPEMVRLRYVELNERTYSLNSSLVFGRYLVGGDGSPSGCNGFCNEAKVLLASERYWKTGDYEAALLAASELVSSRLPGYRHQSLRLAANTLLRLNRIDDCIRTITTALVREPGLHPLMPLKDIVQAISKEDYARLAGDLSLSIIYDLYSKHVLNDREAQRAYAYEDFLLAHGMNKPSELKDIFADFDKEKLLYFLRHLCIEAIMDNSTVFDNSREVAEERLGVCRQLTLLDPDNLDAYQTEIKAILRRLMIRRRLRQYDQSKIYVDTESIKSSPSKTLRENFTRYSALQRTGAFSDAREKIAVQTALYEAGTGNWEGVLQLVLPRNEMTDVFEDMVLELRDQFVSNTEHGLDGYLSVRIRHGTLASHLRSPLEAAKLVTQRDRNTGNYKRNDYWLGRVTASHEIKETIEKRLNLFSEAFDDLVTTVRTEWMQVKRDETGTGLFDFTLRRVFVDVISISLSADTTFEEFLELILRNLRELLEQNLAKIRQKISSELKSQVSELITNLQADIDRLSDPISDDTWLVYYSAYNRAQAQTEIRELSNAIRAAHTELQVVLDRMTEWFYLRDATANDPFSIEEAVDISAETVRTAHQTFNTEVIFESGHNLAFVGTLLASFVDIFTNIFDNIVRKMSII
jgi:hypothetical protein